MTPSDERKLARLRARFEHVAQELPEVGFPLRGSLLERFSKCGSPGCACHTDPARRHGPYWQWTAKIKGKTVTRAVGPDQLPRYRQWTDNAKRIDHIVQELYDLSAQAHDILSAQEREDRELKKKKKKKREKSPTRSPQ